MNHIATVRGRRGKGLSGRRARERKHLLGQQQARKTDHQRART